jgi:polygalacturonase
MTFINASRPVVVPIVLAVSFLAANAGTPQASPMVVMPVIPARTVNLADFGGSGDGGILNTAVFEKAFAMLAEKGGGKLVIPPGIWLTGPMKLRSNINLHLKRGALVKFSGDWKLYPLTVIDMKGEKEVDSISPISGENLENVAITGEGIIDGGGDSWRPIKKGKLGDSDWKVVIKSGGVLNEKGDTWYPSREVMNGERLVEQLRKSGSLKVEDYEPAHQFLRPKMLRLIN